MTETHETRTADARRRLAEHEARKAEQRKAERDAAKRRKAERAEQPAAKRTPEQIQADLADSRARVQRQQRDAELAYHESRQPVVDPKDVSISAAREGAARTKATRRKLGLKASPAKVAEIGARLAEQVAAPLPRNPVERRSRLDIAADRRARLASPYRPGGAPEAGDPLGAIIYGNVSPDLVLAKSVMDDQVQLVNVRTSARPLDYLRFRSRKPISSEQFEAAELFIADNDTMSKFGQGNTAAICDSVENSVPWTARDRAVKDAGDMMKYAAEIHLPKDGSSKLVSAAFRVRRALTQLESWQQTVLKDLLLKDMTVGLIAQRWGVIPEVASFMVQVSLWQLAKVYETTRAEFRDWLVAERQMAEG